MNGQTTQYQYDGLANRIAKTVGSAATRYVVDPNGVLSQVLAETDGSGNITSYYVYGLGLASKVTPAGQVYFYQYDGLGSTIAMTDLSGNVVNKYAYDPFGNLSGNSTETIPNPFRYVGQFGVMDEENGLLYMRARYYSPALGRFVNKDPAGFLGGLNLYAYVGNNPIKNVDPLGLDLYDLSNFFAGAGDALTGGITAWVRQLLGSDTVVDKCSGAYAAGTAVGTGLGLIVAIFTALGHLAIADLPPALRFLNHNDFIRIGFGPWPNSGRIPRISIHRPGWNPSWTHIRL